MIREPARSELAIQPATLGMIPGRVTYVIDRNGIVRHIFSSQFRVKTHVKEALRILQRIDGQDVVR
ncbi:MAG: hypothetical protein ACE5H0_11455 [Bacteroidota bacterium]